MKRKISYISITILMLSIIFIFMNSNHSEEGVKLNSTLELVSENGSKRIYHFSIQSMENKKRNIKMSYKEDVTFSLDTEKNAVLPKNVVMINSPIREKEEMVEIKPNDEMIYIVEVNTEKLPLGRYELNIHFAAANVVVNDPQVEFHVAEGSA